MRKDKANMIMTL